MSIAARISGTAILCDDINMTSPAMCPHRTIEAVVGPQASAIRIRTNTIDEATRIAAMTLRDAAAVARNLLAHVALTHGKGIWSPEVLR
jgi:hypothetical protein